MSLCLLCVFPSIHTPVHSCVAVPSLFSCAATPSLRSYVVPGSLDPPSRGTAVVDGYQQLAVVAMVDVNLLVPRATNDRASRALVCTPAADGVVYGDQCHHRKTGSYVTAEHSIFSTYAITMRTTLLTYVPMYRQVLRSGVLELAGPLTPGRPNPGDHWPMGGAMHGGGGSSEPE